MSATDWLITATPPTPNGDLHVGHLSGPYLAADIFRRAREWLGDTAAYVCYGDDHQSYVVTTAERLGEDPQALMARGNADIAATLDAFAIKMDAYTRPDAAHDAAVRTSIHRLIDAGLVVERQTTHWYDPSGDRLLYEAFATGNCPVCLESTKGGICEACGHPNAPTELLGARIDGSPIEGLEPRHGRDWVIPIEAYREQLIAYYADKRGRWRPHLIQLVDELLARPLADYPISHPGTWGIELGIPGWAGHVINVWAEMGLGLRHALSRLPNAPQQGEGRLVQFLGYDNSYFFAIVHPVLQFALERATGEPAQHAAHIFTNEFYNLENRKFSTSQGHAVWGRELLEHVGVDEARFYLSLNGPELAESNFVLGAMQSSLDRELRAPLRTIAERVAAMPATIGVSELPHYLARIDDRLRFFCEPEHFSAHELARILRNLLGFMSRTDTSDGHVGDAAILLAALRFWAERMQIFMPGFAADLVRRLSAPAIDTAELARAMRHQAIAGRP